MTNYGTEAELVRISSYLKDYGTAIMILLIAINVVLVIIAWGVWNRK